MKRTATNGPEIVVHVYMEMSGTDSIAWTLIHKLEGETELYNDRKQENPQEGLNWKEGLNWTL